MINETPDDKHIKSMKALIEFDCPAKRSRFVAIEMFGSQNFLGSTEVPGEWSYIAPNSPVESLGHAVCASDYRDTMAAAGTPEIMARAALDVLSDSGKPRPRHNRRSTKAPTAKPPA